MKSDGSCPVCHRVIEESPVGVNPVTAPAKQKFDLRALAAGTEDQDVSAPWHFKLLVTGLVLYLGWRIVDLFI